MARAWLPKPLGDIEQHVSRDAKLPAAIAPVRVCYERGERFETGSLGAKLSSLFVIDLGGVPRQAPPRRPFRANMVQERSNTAYSTGVQLARAGPPSGRIRSLGVAALVTGKIKRGGRRGLSKLCDHQATRGRDVVG